MIETLVNHVLALPPERLAEVSLEDMAVCLAWFESYRDDPESQRAFVELPSRVEQWLTLDHPPCDGGGNTEGPRQQPVLRQLIQSAESGTLPRMPRSELDVLHFAGYLARNVEKQGPHGRVLDLLQPYLAQVSKQRLGLDSEPGLPPIGKAVSYLCTDDLRQGNPIEDESFGGLRLTFKGYHTEVMGRVKILEDLPPDCAVNAAEGACHVAGNVFGMLAMSGGCEVLGDVRGAVICREGAIRCAAILEGAQVVAKEGSVACSRAVNPRLVFGARRVFIRTEASGGEYLGAQVEARQAFEGALVQTTHLAKAPLFRHGENAPMQLVLRRSFTCEDYGERIADSGMDLYRKALRARSNYENHARNLVLIEREADEKAGCVLLYLMGGDDSMSRIRELEKWRARLEYINGLIDGAKAMAEAIERRLASHRPGQDDGSSRGMVYLEEENILKSMNAKLDDLRASGLVDREMHNQREVLADLARRLFKKDMDPEGQMQIAASLMNHAARIRGRHAHASERVQRMESAVDQTMGRMSILERARRSHSRIDVLTQLIAASRARGSDSGLLRRMETRYVQHMMKTIDKIQQRVAKLRVNNLELRDQVQQLRAELWQRHRIALGMTGPAAHDAPLARAEGAFPKGAVLCLFPQMLNNKRGAGVLVTPDSMGKQMVYRRTPTGRIEGAELGVLSST